MATTIRARLSLTLLLGTLSGCAGASRLPEMATVGPAPTLTPPEKTMVPTVNVATAVGWPLAESPQPAPGLQVTAFARDLEHPRWICVLPNGDVLVAETNAPPRPEEGGGLRGYLFAKFQKRAGGAVPSANRITLLRDVDGDGIAEVRTIYLRDLNSPFGIAQVENHLYVANTDAVVSVPYAAEATEATAAPTRVLELPAGDRNHHWTKNIVASPDGLRLYVAIGSNSNVAEHGLDEERGRAEIWEFDLIKGTHRTFASGLRNPVGMAFEPQTGALWVAVNERDELGNDLVPDYMTAVKDGAFYGWPDAYYGNHLDDRLDLPRLDKAAAAVVPDYALGAHTASLGLAAANGNRLGPQWQDGMFVGQHGSWNRKPRSGYKVIFVPFANGQPAGAPIDVLTGFALENGDAMGRPVGVAVDSRGGLLVADDVGNTIWRVSAAPRTTSLGLVQDPGRFRRGPVELLTALDGY